MYINRPLLLLLAFGIVFIPSAQEWAIGDSSTWYRPFLIWAVIIAVAWWNQRKSYGDDL